MKGTLTLKNPILINNKTISEMTYDSNEITGALFSEAEAMRKRAAVCAMCPSTRQSNSTSACISTLAMRLSSPSTRGMTSTTWRESTAGT